MAAIQVWNGGQKQNHISKTKHNNTDSSIVKMMQPTNQMLT